MLLFSIIYAMTCKEGVFFLQTEHKPSRDFLPIRDIRVLNWMNRLYMCHIYKLYEHREGQLVYQAVRFE